MQRLEVSDAVRPIYGSLGVKRLTSPMHFSPPSDYVIMTLNIPASRTAELLKGVSDWDGTGTRDSRENPARYTM